MMMTGRIIERRVGKTMICDWNKRNIFKVSKIILQLAKNIFKLAK